MSLRELQDRLSAAMLCARDDDPAIAAAARYVKPAAGLTASRHVGIYRNSVQGRLVTALGEIYPVCRKLVGGTFFDAMALRFVQQTPSRSPDLADYGEALAGFIAQFEPAAELVYLPDVARLEWAWHRAFHAADAAPPRAAALADLDEAQQQTLVFQLPVSASLLHSPWPVHRIWQVNQDDWPGDATVDLGEGEVRLLIWREGYTLRIDPLDAGPWRLLQAIQAGTPLGQLCEELPRLDLERLLPHCVAQGWIGSFGLED